MILAFDERSIKSNLTYNSRVDKVIGYEDFGDIRTNNISTYVTVFMIKSLLGNWKQPVGYFFTSGPMTAEVIKSKVIICVEKLKKCNILTKVIICDQGPGNRGFFKMLKTTPENFFISSGLKIFFLYDPHLIKSIRNALYNKGFGNINFKYIKYIYNMKKTLTIKMKDKLTKKHIELTGFSKMRVNLATQVLSLSVAANIKTIYSLSNAPSKSDALETAEFCEFFNNLFDIFNSKKSNSYIYKNPLTQNYQSMEFLNKAEVK